jgi:Zn-finger nucleic acid-binding protein
MTRFRIALDIPFEIDRCGLCAGVWFNSGEWEFLRARGLARRLNYIFADSWQNQIRHEEARQNQEERYRSLLGDADFKTAQDFKRWLEVHPKRTTVWALLENRDLP